MCRPTLSLITIDLEMKKVLGNWKSDDNKSQQQKQEHWAPVPGSKNYRISFCGCEYLENVLVLWTVDSAILNNFFDQFLKLFWSNTQLRLIYQLLCDPPYRRPHYYSFELHLSVTCLRISTGIAAQSTLGKTFLPENICTVYEKLTTCPNFSWSLPEKYFSGFFGGGGKFPLCPVSSYAYV